MLERRGVVVVDFPAATGSRRRPGVILSSTEYHESRPDVIIGLDHEGLQCYCT